MEPDEVKLALAIALRELNAALVTIAELEDKLLIEHRAALNSAAIFNERIEQCARLTQENEELRAKLRAAMPEDVERDI